MYPTEQSGPFTPAYDMPAALAEAQAQPRQHAPYDMPAQVQHEAETQETAPAGLDRDPFEIPRLEWQGRWQGQLYKCWVTFTSLGDLSGRDLNELRTAASSGNGNYGTGMNALYGLALAKSIIAWEIGYRPTLAPPSGHRNPETALDLLTAPDRRRLEIHIHDQLNALIEPTSGPDSGPGSPLVPASD